MRPVEDDDDEVEDEDLDLGWNDEDLEVSKYLKFWSDLLGYVHRCKFGDRSEFSVTFLHLYN